MAMDRANMVKYKQYICTDVRNAGGAVLAARPLFDDEGRKTKDEGRRRRRQIGRFLSSFVFRLSSFVRQIGVAAYIHVCNEIYCY